MTIEVGLDDRGRWPSSVGRADQGRPLRGSAATLSLPEQLGQLLAGGDAGLLQDVVHVGLHGAQGQLQGAGDVLVVLAL